MSNPIISKDRYTISDMIATAGIAMKQNLKGLQELAQGEPRDILSSLPDPDYELSKSLLGGGVTALDVQGQTIDLTCLEVYKDACPISTLKYKDVQIHPEAQHQVRGKVSVKRTFGRVGKQDSILSAAATAAFDLPFLEEIRDQTVYTSGTPIGFSKRIKELTTRQCKSEGNPTQIAQTLMKLLPTKALPDWHETDLLMDTVKITASANAGPPCWTSNRTALPAVLEVLLPLVLQHIEAGTLDQLALEQPELFISELKNKTDRYAIDKVTDKTRPYVNQGTQFSFLFSCLMQPFCSSLETWDKNESSMNAYGWSMAKGGIKRVYNMVLKQQKLAIRKRAHRFKIGLYGDDAKLFMMTPSGRVYAVDPDFRQMDGSVDFDTVVGVTRWISHMYTEQHGESPLWDRVLELLAIMATHPTLIIDGSTLYKKKNRDGLLSGAVGTTLFDTAKSALAYNDLINQFEIDHTKFHDAKWVENFMKTKHGLVIKEGTWNPEEITNRMEPEEGLLWTTNKFLGMRFMWKSFNNPSGEQEFTLVPTLNDDEWLDLILHPRDDINTEGTRLSSVASQRRSLDRARGYLVTGAVFNKNISQVLKKAIDLVPPVAVLMAVASGNGRGEAPGEHQIVGEDFEYPNSEGVPNDAWITRLYTKYGPDPKDWVPIFPTIHDKLKLERTTWKQRLRNVAKMSEIPSDPMTKFIVTSYTNTSVLPPLMKTSFADKTPIVKLPHTGNTSGEPQSRINYAKAIIATDNIMPLLARPPARAVSDPKVLITDPKLPKLVKPHYLIVDESEADVFKIKVEVNTQRLETYVLPLEDEQPSLRWANFLDPRNRGVVKYTTEVIKYVPNTIEGEPPVAYKKVTAYMEYPTHKETLAYTETAYSAALAKKALIFKMYKVMVDMHDCGMIQTRNVCKNRPGRIYRIPSAYTEKEAETSDKLGNWAFDSEVTTQVEKVQKVREDGKDPFELELTKRRETIEMLMKELEDHVSKYKHRNDEYRKQKEEERQRAKKQCATKAPTTTTTTKEQTGGHNSGRSGKRHRNSNGANSGRK